jgi:hypothetical protein
MKTTVEFLDALKAKTGAGSDYRIAKILNVTTSCIGNYRSGRSKFDDKTALKVASILDIEPGVVMAACHAERAKSEEEKTAWKLVFEKLGGMAAAVTLGIMLTAPTPSQANTGAGSGVRHNSDLSIHYAK